MVTVGGVALFAGYRMGVKDGFQGGVHTGRRMERGLIAREDRYLPAPAQGYSLESPDGYLALPSPEGASEQLPPEQATAPELDEFSVGLPVEESQNPAEHDSRWDDW